MPFTVKLVTVILNSAFATQMAGVWTCNTKVVGSTISLGSQVLYGNKTALHLCFKPNINKPAKPATNITTKTPVKLYINSNKAI